MSKTIKTLAAITTFAAAAGLAYAQNVVNTPASAEPLNTTQGPVVDSTGTTGSQSTYRSSPTAVNNSEQAPTTSVTSPQGATMGNADSNSVNTSPTKMNNGTMGSSDATLANDPASTTPRAARADRN